MVNSEEIFGTTVYLTPRKRFSANRCRYNGVRLHMICLMSEHCIKDNTVHQTFVTFELFTFTHCYV